MAPVQPDLFPFEVRVEPTDDLDAFLAAAEVFGLGAATLEAARGHQVVRFTEAPRVWDVVATEGVDGLHRRMLEGFPAMAGLLRGRGGRLELERRWDRAVVAAADL